MIYYGKATYFFDDDRKNESIALAAESFIDAQSKLQSYYGEDLVAIQLEEISDNDSLIVFKEDIREKIDTDWT